MEINESLKDLYSLKEKIINLFEFEHNILFDIKKIINRYC